MKLSKRVSTSTFALCTTAALVAGCGGGSSSTPSAGSSSKVVDGGTFTMGLKGDPGNLDPQSSAQSALFTLTQLAYDPLLSVDAKTGAIQSGLATKWAVQGKKVTLTLADGITCSDGSDFTAADVAANIAYVGDPKNKSAFLGTYLPVGAKAKADDATRTVTITLASPAPFVLNGLASLPMVCRQGMKDRKSLSSTTDGTGPYQLTEAAPGDHYTYKIRDGYTWGPNGATTATPGMPDQIVMKIVENESTAANLLLSGGLNAAAVLGPDSTRLDKAGLFSTRTTALLGEQWYNHGKGHATSDPALRMALTQALDLGQLEKVLTSDKGTPATTLAAIEPVACPGDSVSGSVPAQDVTAAKSAATKASPQTLSFIYDSAGGPAVAAAAELAVQQWKAAGIPVKAKGVDEATINQTLFGTGDWDIAWVPLNVNSPDQLVPFLSGPGLADGGTNFSGIDNKTYSAGVQKASAMQGTSGCDTWLGAESELFKAADIVPFANSAVQTFGNGAEFETPGQLVPTSIRMVAK
jgi:peptide/nickel transport system substrate-binding protein